MSKIQIKFRAFSDLFNTQTITQQHMQSPESSDIFISFCFIVSGHFYFPKARLESENRAKMELWEGWKPIVTYFQTSQRPLFARFPVCSITVDKKCIGSHSCIIISDLCWHGTSFLPSLDLAFGSCVQSARNIHFRPSGKI